MISIPGLSLALVLAVSPAMAQQQAPAATEPSLSVPPETKPTEAPIAGPGKGSTVRQDAAGKEAGKQQGTATGTTDAKGSVGATGTTTGSTGGGNPSQTVSTSEGGKTPAKGAAGALPEFRIWCVYVFDRPGFTLGRSKDLETPKVEEASEITCPARNTQSLVGAGEVGIVLDPGSYKQLETYQEEKGAKATLYINGVDLGKDAELIGVQRLPGRTVLQYKISPGGNSKRLWAAIYRSGKATASHPLNAALGFPTGPVTIGTTGASAEVAITSSFSFWAAMVIIVILIFLTLRLGRRTDIFRDAKTPPSFTRAWAARNELDGRAETELKVLSGLHPAYKVENTMLYLDVADRALAGDLNDLDPDMLAVGLVLRRDKWHSVRPSYSLGRVQLGMWFLFAVATGVFLCLIYGALPELDGSVLGLLGLSVAGTSVSLAIDSSNQNVRFSPTNGLWQDMTTSWDDKHQVYRFQAVVVNLLLLGVGILHVSRHLTYPIFDETWLAFLGISSLALAAGKSVVETKTDAPPAKPTTPPAQ